VATYLLGIAFLLFCLLGIPLLKRILHERAVRGVAMEGVSVVPSFWTPSGLRLQRPGWQGVASFEATGIGGTGRGHLRLKVEVTGPESREVGPDVLARLEALGGRVRTNDRGVVEIDGPIFIRSEDLRKFLEACDALVQGKA